MLDFAIQHLQLKTDIVDVFAVCSVFKQYKTHNFKCVKLGDYVLSFFILIYTWWNFPFLKIWTIGCFSVLCNLSQVKHLTLKCLYTLDIQFWIIVSNFSNLPIGSLILTTWLTCQVYHHLTFFLFYCCD